MYETNLPDKVHQKPAAAFVSHDLNNLFELERRENNAARKIQIAYKKMFIFNRIRHAVLCVTKAVKLQTWFRGLIARKFTATWFNVRNTLVVRWQGCIRKWISNRHLRPKQAFERSMVIRIQKMIRGKLGRLRWNWHNRWLAASRIQVMWRGVRDRHHADGLWLNKVIIPLQTIARRMIGKMRCDTNRKELDLQASFIQRTYLCWAASQRLGKALYNREIDYRSNVIDQLRNEEDHCCNRILTLSTRLHQSGLRESLDMAAQELERGQDESERLHRGYVELDRQREVLSPRSIKQGWRVELEQQRYNMKCEMTTLKAKVLFDYLPHTLQLEEQLEKRVLEIEHEANVRDCVSAFRETEYLSRRETCYWRDTVANRKNMRQAVADEKRQWQVVWCVRNGKPDRRRRPGRSWDKSVYADIDQTTYSATEGVDLFAEDRDKDKVLGTEDQLKHTVKCLTLQTFLDQLQTYESILEPITQIMQKVTCAPPASYNIKKRKEVAPAAPEALGFGEVGKKLAPAMWKIGAAPSTYHKPLSPGGSTIATAAAEPSASSAFATPTMHRSSYRDASTTSMEEEDRAWGIVNDDSSATETDTSSPIGTHTSTSAVHSLSQQHTHLSPLSVITNMSPAPVYGTKGSNPVIRPVSGVVHGTSTGAGGAAGSRLPSGRRVLSALPSRHTNKHAHRHVNRVDTKKDIRIGSQLDQHTDLLLSLPTATTRRTLSALATTGRGDGYTSLQMAEDAQARPNSAAAVLPDLLTTSTVTSSHSNSNRSVSNRPMSAAQLRMQQDMVHRRKLRKERRAADKKEFSGCGSVIPWAMLDQLDTEKQKFENDKAFTDLYLKF